MKAKDYVYEDEEEAFSNNFDILDKLKSSKFSKFFIQEMRGEAVNLEHFQRQGFNSPIFVPEKERVRDLPKVLSAVSLSVAFASARADAFDHLI